MKTYIFTLIFVCTCFGAFSQTRNDMPSGLDDTKNGVKQKVPKEDNDEVDEIDDNIISLSPGHAARNMAVISYDRFVLNERFSVGGSIGLCFREDMLISSTKKNELHYDMNDIRSNPYILTFNPYADLNFKVHTNVFDGVFYNWTLYKFYVGVNLRTYKNSFSVSSYPEPPASLKSHVINNYAATLQLGGTTITAFGITSEYYVGFGYISSRYTGFTRPSLSNNEPFVYDNFKSTYNRPYVTIGYKFGICF